VRALTTARPDAAQSVNFKYEAGAAGMATRAARDEGREQSKEERKRVKQSKTEAEAEARAAAAATVMGGLMGPSSDSLRPSQEETACGFALLLSAGMPF